MNVFTISPCRKKIKREIVFFPKNPTEPHGERIMTQAKRSARIRLPLSCGFLCRTKFKTASGVPPRRLILITCLHGTRKRIRPLSPRAAGSFPASSGRAAESAKELFFSGFHLDFLKKWSIVLLTFPKGSGEMPEWPKGTVC